MTKRVLDVGNCVPDHTLIAGFLRREFGAEVVRVQEWADAREALAGGALLIGALLVGHHGEVEGDPADPRQGGDGGGDSAGDLVAQRTAGNGERDLDCDNPVVTEHGTADHPQVDDRTPQLGILHGAQRLDDLLTGGCRHGHPFGEWSGKRVAANYHYADR